MLAAGSTIDRTPAPFFATDLVKFGDRIALVTDNENISYADLAERVAGVAGTLLGERHLTLIAGTNTAAGLVAYLAALRCDNAVLLAPPDSAGELVGEYDPDIIIGTSGPGVIDVRREGSVHALHPDLALLLTTSGSTGSSKLVRLSRQNLQANAESIAEYLGITAADRAITTLPMYYSYGLSVIHSYLLRGASLVLNDQSVAEDAFWRRVRETEVTSFAGVPHTFELLDRVGFDTVRLPRLRYITQAGGRLAPERVRHYAELGRRHGWQFYAMYGQTEATARIAYLPTHLAETRPECIGVAIPGGSLRLDPLPDEDDPRTGELVYSGPNVMLGYAQGPADLALGRTVDELHTGDIARLTGDGLFQIIGRRSRFLKLFGLRIDLQRIEEILAAEGVTAHCLGDDTELIVAVVRDDRPAPDAATVRDLVVTRCGLPQRTVRFVEVADVPRTGNGKINYPALRTMAAPAQEAGPAAGDRDADVGAIYALVLGRPDVTEESTFASLGGDSLSYVEASVRLEQALGTLPANWHTMSVRQLRTVRRGDGSRRRSTLETSVALRAASIFLIMGQHAHLFAVKGGAHVLLAVAGFNFGRFLAIDVPRGDRARKILANVARLVVPAFAIFAVLVLFGDTLSWSNLIFASFLFGDPGGFPFWFIDSLLYTVLTMLIVLSTRFGDALARRSPFGLPLGLVGVGLVFRYNLVPGVDLSDLTTSSPDVLIRGFWLFALGWATAKATTVWQRILLTVITVLTVPGFFDWLTREAIIVAAVVALIWLPTLPSTRWVNRAAGAIAGASLYLYLTHFPVVTRVPGLLSAVPQWLAEAIAICVALVLGLLVAWLARSVERRLMALWRSRLRRSPDPDTPGQRATSMIEVL